MKNFLMSFQWKAEEVTCTAKTKYEDIDRQCFTLELKKKNLLNIPELMVIFLFEI